MSFTDHATIGSYVFLSCMNMISIQVKMIMNGVNTNYVLTGLSLQNTMCKFYSTNTSKWTFDMIITLLLCFILVGILSDVLYLLELFVKKHESTKYCSEYINL